MDITIKMPLKDWNELQHIIIESEAFMTVVGNKYMKLFAASHIERIKQAVQIIDDAREAHDDEVKPISFGVDFGKGESISAVTKWKDGKIVEVEYE